ncbi:ABC transporter permease [Rhizobium sp. 2MFCol3.1]|uniref:ABC transporter permease n=1 Tax=Rhizobium sp. 2MFCol3.1 TaxID=1246459 RepID=UPI00037DAC82|nr:ABC transporter permease [Rhizobium sp. 2MFCol3.1]
MINIIVRRLVIAVPTLLLVSVLIFSMQKLLPGDPALMFAGEERDPVVLEQLREKFHLNDPLPVQYGRWLWQILHGDLGMSLRTEVPVGELISQKLPVTFQLSLTAMLFAVLFGVPAGILSAVKRGKALDYITGMIGLTGMSIPHFWLGIIMIMVISVQLGLLPSSGMVSIFDSPLLFFQSVLMPAFVLSTPVAAYLMRHTRSAMLGVLRSDYIRTARAKGLRANSVVFKHALRNALTPIVTMVTLLFGELLAGAVLTEQIFTIPGFGKLIVDAVFTRDYAVVQGVVLCSAVAFILLNLIADVVYILITPRLRYA